MSGYTIVLISVILIYLGLSLGIAIRFTEEKKYYLVVLSLFMPLFILTVNILCLKDIIFKSKRKFKNKIRDFKLMLYIMVRYYNIVIDFNIQIFAKSSLNERIKSLFHRTANDYQSYSLESFGVILDKNENFIKDGLKIRIV